MPSLPQCTAHTTYLVADVNTKAAALIDSVLEQVECGLKLINELGLILEFCLETQVHADGVSSAGELRSLAEDEGIVPDTPQTADIETWGHADSHGAYPVNHTHILSGDALLIPGCGCADLQRRDAETL